MSIRLPSGELVRMFADVTPFATDDSHPLLESVRLSWDGTTLSATATDRYVVGRSLWALSDTPDATECGGPDHAWSIRLHLPHVKRLVAALQDYDDVDMFEAHPRRSYENSVTRLERGEGTLRVTATPDDVEVSLTIREFTVKGISNLPEIDQAIERHLDIGATLRDANADDGVTYNPQFLALFQEVAARHGQSLMLRQAGHATPTQVIIGGQFVGVIAPTRTREAAPLAARS